MSLPSYPHYRDSEINWLGHVPKHWEITRFKNSLTSKQETVGDRFTEYPLLSLTLKGVIPRDLENPHGKFPTSFETYQSVNVGDLIFCLFDVEETPQAVGLSRYAGMVTGAYTVAEAKPGFLPDYIFYYYYARDQYKAWRMFYTGLRNVIRWDTFCNISCLKPPFSEQIAIAAFLDRETAKIDTLIAEQEKLLTLLTEKRQATISHAVTKGLNPDVPMKDSGVEWLGEVPTHWDIKSIRYILDAIGDVDHFMPESVEDGVPYLMTGDLKEVVSDVSLDDCKQVSWSDYQELSKRIKNSKDDVIMARYATIGTSMYVDIDVDFLVSYSCVTLKTNKSQVSGLYLFHYMKSNAFRQGIETQINTNTQGNVGIKDLQDVKIAVPPINEQPHIAAFLDSEAKKFNALKNESERGIKLLKERRSALISAAVTGQIDVRNAVSEAATA